MPNNKQKELPPIEFPRLKRIITIPQNTYHKLPQPVQERIKRPDVEQILLRTFDILRIRHTSKKADRRVDNKHS